MKTNGNKAEEGTSKKQPLLKKKNTTLYHEFSIIQSKSIIAASAPATFKVKMPQRLTVSAGPK